MRHFAILALAICAVTPNDAEAWSFLEDIGVLDVKDYLDISVAIDSRCDDPEYPLLVKIYNGFDSPIGEVSFEIMGREVERSTPVYEHSYGPRYSSDYIIPSGETYSSCWAIPIGSLYEQCRMDTECTYNGTGEREKIAKYPPSKMLWYGKIIRADPLD